MKITLAQLPVGVDPAGNLKRVLAVLRDAAPGDTVVFPEGMLSGYEPQDPGYLKDLDPEVVEDAIDEVRRATEDRGCRCLVGSATFQDGHWYNTILLLDREFGTRRYHKSELFTLDRRHFSPGPSAGMLFECGGVKIGVFACRELIFPEPWARLKRQGSQVVFHLNNAIQPHDAIWEHLLIARAIEQSIFVCSVNNANPPQSLASYLVAPSGQVLLRTETRREQVLTTRIDLSQVVADLATRSDY